MRAGGGAERAPGSSRPWDAVPRRKIDEIVIGAAVRSRLRRCSRPSPSPGVSSLPRKLPCRVSFLMLILSLMVFSRFGFWKLDESQFI